LRENKKNGKGKEYFYENKIKVEDGNGEIKEYDLIVNYYLNVNS